MFKNLLKRKAWLACLAAMLSVAMVFPAMASTTSIDSVSLNLSYRIKEDDTDTNVRVTANSGKYEVDEVEVTNEPSDGWDEGDKPKIEVTLTTDTDDYKFSSMSKSDVTLNGDEGTVTSVSKKSNSTLTVKITLAEIEGKNYDLTVSGLNLGSNTGVASWNGARDAQSYEVRLYRGSSSVTSVMTTTNTYYNFSSYFTKSGTYTFKVRAIYDSSHTGSWVESDELTVDSDQAAAIVENGGVSSGSSYNPGNQPGNMPNQQPGNQPGGQQNGGNTGWSKDGKGWTYRDTNNNTLKKQWKSIGNKWYFFDDDGYMKTGWFQNNGKWYYCNTDGEMKTGWIQDGDKWYYCNESGEMLADTTTPDGYRVGPDGAWMR